MKILLLNYTDSGGGAAIAAYRLLCALNKQGVDATLGVIDKKTSDDSVAVLSHKSFFKKFIFISIISKIYTKIISYIAKSEFQTTNPISHSRNRKTKIDINYINNSDYDLVHLHWVNSDMISIEGVAKINKPIVWTMHDSWVFCGAEHHPNILENDHRFVTGYTCKNKPKTTSGIDICRKTWERKKRHGRAVVLILFHPAIMKRNHLITVRFFIMRNVP